MNRKINRVGTNTLTVSLPRSWVKKHKLKQGQELSVTEYGKKIVFSVEPAKQESTYSLQIPEGEFLLRYLERPYIAGYDEIKFTFKNYEILVELQEAIQRLIGVDIVQQDSKSCTAKVFVTEEMKEIKKTMISVFCTVKMMFDTLFDSLKKKNFENLKKLKSLDDSISRLTSLSLRLINKGNVIGEIRSSVYYASLSRELEHIGDQFSFISQACEFQKGDEINQELFNFLDFVKKRFELLYDFYIKPKWDKVHFLKSARNIYKTKIHGLFKKLNYNEAIILQRLLGMLSDISYLKASTGLSLEALFAGKSPLRQPTIKENINAPRIKYQGK